ALGLTTAQVEHPYHVAVYGVQGAVMDGTAEGLVQCQPVAGCADPLGGMDGAIGIDEGNIAVVLLLVLGNTGIHGDDQVALGIEGAALGHAEAAENLNVGGHGGGHAGFIGSAEWSSGGELATA